jgi:molybdopterin converting factor subunit 1
MDIRVRLFARAKDLVGADAVTVTVPTGVTIGDLRRELAKEYPALASILERSAIAINDEFADDSLTVAVNSEIAVLPPVSGGMNV